MSAPHGLSGGAEFGVFDQVLAGVVGDFADYRLCHYSVVVGVEAHVFCIPCGDAQGLNNQPGAGWVERAFDQAVDYVHARELEDSQSSSRAMEWSCMSTRCCTALMTRVWK